MSEDNQQAEQNENAGPSISLNDLIMVGQMIQISANRGTWRAEEMAQVGSLYNKLIAFLEQSGAITRQQSEESSTPPEGTEEMGHA